MKIEFVKYEGAGNDFIMIDCRVENALLTRGEIVALCDRRFGIGADGLMTLHASESCDCVMHYYNADGSEGELCGNGGRCFALFAEHLNIGGSTKMFDALDGAHSAEIVTRDKYKGEVRLSMIDVESIVCGDGYWFLNTGVPHYVEFVEDVDSVDVCGRGREIRHDKRFPQGVNVNFVQVVGVGEIKMRTYERGVENETLACGTGATAAAMVTNLATQSSVGRFLVHVRGGDLTIEFEREGEMCYRNIYLTGGARRVFEGVIDSGNI